MFAELNSQSAKGPSSWEPRYRDSKTQVHIPYREGKAGCDWNHVTMSLFRHRMWNGPIQSDFFFEFALSWALCSLLPVSPVGPNGHCSLRFDQYSCGPGAESSGWSRGVKPRVRFRDVLNFFLRSFDHFYWRIKQSQRSFNFRWMVQALGYVLIYLVKGCLPWQVGESSCKLLVECWSMLIP